MTKKTASKVESKARSEKRAFSAAVRGLRKSVADGDMSAQEAVAMRRELAIEHGVKVGL